MLSPDFQVFHYCKKVIYTTYAIEHLNAMYRKRNRRRSVFPSDTALPKALYLSSIEVTKIWTMPLRNRGGRSMENSVSCTKAGCRNNALKIRLFDSRETACSWYASACAVIYKVRAESASESFQPNHCHRRSALTDFYSSTQLISISIRKGVFLWTPL